MMFRASNAVLWIKPGMVVCKADVLTALLSLKSLNLFSELKKSCENQRSKLQPLIKVAGDGGVRVHGNTVGGKLALIVEMVWKSVCLRSRYQ